MTRAFVGVCECGCGAALPALRRPDRGAPRFATGHNRRKHVTTYCHGERARVYVHDGRGWCAGCRSWVPVIH